MPCFKAHTVPNAIRKALATVLRGAIRASGSWLCLLRGLGPLADTKLRRSPFSDTGASIIATLPFCTGLPTGSANLLVMGLSSNLHRGASSSLKAVFN